MNVFVSLMRKSFVLKFRLISVLVSFGLVKPGHYTYPGSLAGNPLST
jgi:hypothetical protein